MWMGAKADITGITTQNVTTLEDGIMFVAIAESKILCLNKTSTATADNTSVWTATPSGRWHLITGIPANQTIVSSTQPSTVLSIGTTYIWTENNAANSYDSVITYVSNGSSWIEINSRLRVHNNTPESLSLTPNSESELWKDTSTGVLYNAFNGGWITVDSLGGT